MGATHIYSCLVGTTLAHVQHRPAEEATDLQLVAVWLVLQDIWRGAIQETYGGEEWDAVEPRPGRAFVFFHTIVHEGLPPNLGSQKFKSVKLLSHDPLAPT